MPFNLEKNLRERCHVNTNAEGDSFVGVKADTEDAMIYFPIGYQLPDNDDDLRVDINNLFGILAAFMKEDKVIEESKFEAPRTVDFPMHAYLSIIRDYLRTGRYYRETSPEFRTDTKGNANWPRTAREQTPLIQKNGSMVFPKMTVRVVTPRDNEDITQIHMYCVHQAFDKLGWYYVSFVPPGPETHPSIKQSIYILRKKLASTHNDVEQELFGAMLKMLEYEDEKGDDKQYFFGTDYFERVWESMVDQAFGIPDKDKYFPRTRWLLDYGRVKQKTPLQPDSIMIYGDRYYVLDSKLYKYGWTAIPDDLPNGPDINKQITYAEYIERVKGIPSERLFNAFIMPYNMEDNLFMLHSRFGNIGEAVGDWRGNTKYYERIQGIVIDTRYLMWNYIGTPEEQKRELAECIERVMARDPVPLPTTT